METEGSKGNVQRYIYTAKGINRLLIAVQRSRRSRRGWLLYINQF
ncbi:hypothetical protein [Kamptonema formosum]|nr:hypothetical protein [Kamptonema formosum]